MQNGMSGFPRADMCSALSDVRFVPIADTSALSPASKLDCLSLKRKLPAVAISGAISQSRSRSGYLMEPVFLPDRREIQLHRSRPVADA